MPRYSKTLTPAALAGFLAALRRGAAVVEAAAGVGVAVSGLYCRRKRDAAFDAAWRFAAEASSGWTWDDGTGRKARAEGTRRRLRFAGRRRAAFLLVLERDCNTNGAAAETGVHRSTVRRHLRRDAGFAQEAGEALRRGYAELERESAEARAAMQARIDSGERLRAIEPRGRISRDFDEQMRLLARWDRRDGTLGPRRVRRGRMRSMSFDDAMVVLARRLRWMGIWPREPGGPFP
ncbi:MAG TPA: hypothetical protein VEA60_05195 [Allosphingosinicella sp.]|nr:hypothetical protein [Allosphingosinicella sp.]